MSHCDASHEDIASLTTFRGVTFVMQRITCDKVWQHSNIRYSTWKASGNPKSLSIRSPQRHIHSTSNQDTFTPFLAFSLPPRTTSNSMGQHVVRNHVCLCWMVCNLSVLPQVLGSTSQKASNFQVDAVANEMFKPFQAYQLTILEPAEVLPPSTQSLSIFRSPSPHESCRPWSSQTFFNFFAFWAKC